MGRSLTKVFIASTMVVSTLMLQGCTDQEVAIGAGVIIGVAIGSAGNNDHYDRSPPPRYPDRGYGRDRGHDRGSYDGRRYDSQTLATVNGSEETSAVQVFAANYDISEDTAEKVLVSLDETQNGNMAALQDIGLEKADLVAVLKDQKLSDNTMDKVSEKLQMTKEASVRLIQKIKAKVQIAIKQKRPATPSYIPGH